MKTVALILLAFPADIVAQSRPPPPPENIVSRVETHRSDVFDTTESKAWYARWMNTLHVQTHEKVIRRESLISAGEAYDSDQAAETVRNLRKLGVFGTVSLDTIRDPELVVRIHTQDAWSTKPFVSYKSAGSQAIWGFGIREENLLGRLIAVLVSYRHETDRTIKKLAISAPRIIGNQVTLAGVVEKFSDGHHDSLAVAFPFFSLSARNAAFLTGEIFNGDVLQYFNGEHTASDTLKRHYSIGRASLSRAVQAGDRGYVRLALDGQYRRDDFVPVAVASTIGQTTTAAVFGYAEWDRADFAVVQHYRNLGPDEDVDLSTTTRAGLSLAPEQWGYSRNGVGPFFNIRTGLKLGEGFVTFQSEGTSLFSLGLDSGTVTVDVTGFLAPRPRHSLVLHADAGWSRNPVPSDVFDLGLTRGPRAFPDHAFTGDRSFVTLAEYKWVVWPDIKHLASAALAGFVDYGGAWYNGSAHRTGTDLGAGIRVGSIRLPSVAGALRLDIARRFKNDVEPAGWVLVFGSGLAFERVLK
ncbi:MAG TPA: hypothetical protein VGN73_11075 [Gemmatimonadaceae bacterium]|nr:hypothetical protein [Gemmatimonadaceae bacterium]